ncbi:MAG: GNAT family N-acyltransferase [Pelagibaca sp.]
MAAAAQSVAARPAAVSLRVGRYSACIGTSSEIRTDALALRSRAFRKGADDEDTFDDQSLHGVVTCALAQPVVAFRARILTNHTDLAGCYTGQVYDLGTLMSAHGPWLELGRFCQADGPPDVMALRLAWAALSVLVDRTGTQMMIGCSSLPGADPERHRAALSLLRASHLGPATLRPRKLSPLAIDLPEDQITEASLPHLLRSYLGMGGWVSDHAVRDPNLDTLHLFTGLEIAAIPEPRKTRLRALAQTAQQGDANPLDVAPAAP